MSTTRPTPPRQTGEREPGTRPDGEAAPPQTIDPAPDGIPDVPPTPAPDPLPRPGPRTERR